MNRYGRQAQAHWAKWRPNELSQFSDPETFFSNLGLQVETEVDQLAAALAGDDPGGEDYLAKLGRLRMARFTAEAQVLRELVLLPPEPGHPEGEDDPIPSSTRTTPWLPMEMTPDHPNYHDLDDDPFLRRITLPEVPTPNHPAAT